MTTTAAELVCVFTWWERRRRADEQSDLATMNDMQPLSVIKHPVDWLRAAVPRNDT